jgi:hypothetical protein
MSLESKGCDKHMAAEMKMFRSLIMKYFPAELMAKLYFLTECYDINNNDKTQDVIALLKEFNVPFTPLGNGTNRYGILIDGYAVKIALDRAGKTDNQREFKYGYQFYPDVVKVYECAPEGLVAVFEYIRIFTMEDFYDNQNKMRSILEKISQGYLIGDVGISADNYINWGTRYDGSIAILDFAYIYSLSYRGFLCTCEDEGILQFDNDYNYLKCPFCGRKWSFSDIRKRISKADEANEIGDIFECGYVLTSDSEVHEVDPEKSPMEKLTEKKLSENDIKRQRLREIEEAQKESGEMTLDEKLEFLHNLNKEMEDDSNG